MMNRTQGGRRTSLAPSIQSDDMPRTRRQSLSRSSVVLNFSTIARRIRSKVVTLNLLRQMASLPKEPEVEYENSYQMHPTRKTRFLPDKVREILDETLAEYIHKRPYDPEVMATLALSISTAVKNEVKKLNFKRYKFVCHVTLIQNQGQPITSVSRCVWDERKDDVATATYHGLEILAVLSVYGLYFE